MVSDGISEWDVASSFAQFTYQVANPMLALGQKQALQFDDLMQVSARDKVTPLERDLKVAYANSRKIFGIPRIYIALMNAHFNMMIVCAIFSILEGSVRVLMPIVLSWLLSALADSNTSDSEAYTYAAILGSLGLIQTLVHHTLYLFTMRMGWNWRAAVTALIYDRLFYLNGSTNINTGTSTSVGAVGDVKGNGTLNTGTLINMISSDVQRIELSAVTVNFTWECWLEFGAILYVLIDKLTFLPAIAGVGVTLFFIPVQIILAKRFARIRSRTTRETDKRVRHISEVIDGVSSVKSYSWERPFYELIGRFRTREVNSIRNSNVIKAANYGLEYALPPVALFVIFVVYRELSHTLTIPVVFSTLALMQVLKTVMGRTWTLSLERGSETISSCARIDTFLAMTDERALVDMNAGYSGSSVSVGDSSNTVVDASRIPAPVSVPLDTHIELVDITTTKNTGLDTSIAFTSPDGDDTSQGVLLTDDSILYELTVPTAFSYEQNSHSTTNMDTAAIRPGSRSPQPPTLRGIQFSVHRGELVLVVGGVGAGKSSLLLSMMNEIPAVPTEFVSGSALVPEFKPVSSCRRAYCAQRPWIIAATVRENIIIAGSRNNYSNPGSVAGRMRVDSVSGGELDETLYSEALESCCIVEDLDGWAAYDATEIGERGISVSGGQKARIALARAVYSDADCK